MYFLDSFFASHTGSVHKLVNNYKIYLYLDYVGNVTGKWIWILHHAYTTWLDTLEVSVSQFSEPDIISDRKGTQVPKTQVNGLKQVKKWWKVWFNCSWKLFFGWFQVVYMLENTISDTQSVTIDIYRTYSFHFIC